MQSPSSGAPELRPFSCRYSPQIPELLHRLGCTLALSTYQAGKLVFVSAKDKDSLVQLPRAFKKPMGIALDADKGKMALACQDEVIQFSLSADLAKHYPKAPHRYDGMFLPRMTYHTGALDLHDLHFGGDGKLYAVNTLFSCLMTVDEEYSFRPIWQPDFIDALVSEDRCHLNGLAMLEGQPKYVSAFGQGNSPQSWRSDMTNTGLIIDVESGETVIEGLAMPHTPRIFNGQLYCLLSATGELVKMDRERGTYDVICELGGFVRGMDLYQDYLFIGLSKLRKNSSSFGKLDFAERSNEASVVILHLPTGSLYGKIEYLNSLDEIYDISILPNLRRPNIMSTLKDDHKQALMTPDATFWASPQARH